MIELLCSDNRHAKFDSLQNTRSELNALRIMPACVIIVENLPVPFDRRVWQEAQALRDAGWDVSVICPSNKQYPKRFEMVDGIAIFRHWLPIEARVKFGFLLEYGVALLQEARLLFKLYRTRGFDVIQICNPPDILFINTLPYKCFGTRVVFDHHDVCPELFVAKFRRKGLLHRLMLLAERMTVKVADVVITANETFRMMVVERCGKPADKVVAVYSVPDRSYLRRSASSSRLRKGVRVVIGFVGIISDQDGVDQLVRMLHHLVVDHGCRDIRAIVVGDGPALADVRKLTEELNLTDWISFTGYLRGDELTEAVSSFDIGIIPDPPNEYNDKISMNKVFEYSALGVPTVAYNLTETRRLLGDTAVYADDKNPAALARACLMLIKDDSERRARGLAAKALADEHFEWARERGKYIDVYQKLAKPVRVLKSRRCKSEFL